MMRFLIGLIFTSIIVVGCSSEPEYKIEPGSPAEALQAFIKAVLEGDVATYLNTLDSNARNQSYGAAQIKSENFEEIMKQQLENFRPQYEGARILGEKITGNTAVVTLGKDGDPCNAEVPMIKEASGWKLRLTK